MQTYIHNDITLHWLHYITLHCITMHTYSTFDQPSSTTHPNQSTASNPLPTMVPLSSFAAATEGNGASALHEPGSLEGCCRRWGQEKEMKRANANTHASNQRSFFSSPKNGTAIFFFLKCLGKLRDKQTEIWFCQPGQNREDMILSAMYIVWWCLMSVYKVHLLPHSKPVYMEK